MAAKDGSRNVSVSELDRLVSESRNPATSDIDLMSAREMVAAINAQDRLVAGAVEAVLPEVALAVDRIVEAFQDGGRLIYVGAGTSGRLGILDASECPPTFSVPEGLVIGLIAGGGAAAFRSMEEAEDDPAAGAQDLRNVNLSGNDVVVGIAASGRTPYVVGALQYARQVGATTVALSCNLNSRTANIADIAITPVVGPEAVTGSTRMKSGTAQKMVLNMLTTASMIRRGKTYQNLMVDLKASNDKLLARALRTVMQATNCTEADARTALAATGNDVKLAILIHLTGLDLAAARDALERSGGYLRRAVQDNS